MGAGRLLLAVGGGAAAFMSSRFIINGISSALSGVVNAHNRPCDGKPDEVSLHGCGGSPLPFIR